MEQDTIDLLKDLVAIDSQNPSLVPGAAGESRIAGYVADWAKGAGLAAEIVEGTPGRPSVLVRSGAGSGRSLLLCGHLDTVGVSEMSDPLTPDFCTLTIERRTLPGETTEDTERDIAGLLDRCRAADPALRVSSRTTLARAPFEVADDEPIVQAVARAAADTTGKPAELAGASYWADAAFIAAAGIPTVLFGPDGDGAHAREEWVSLPGTVACAQALTAAATDFCQG